MVLFVRGKFSWYCFLLIAQNIYLNIFFRDIIKFSKNFYKDLIYFTLSNNIRKYSVFVNYQYFNLYYLNNIYKINLKEKNINTIKILPKKVIKHILYKTRYKHYKRFKIKYFNEVIYMFLICIWLKNSKLLCQFIKYKLDTIHFKQHRTYFLFFLKIFNIYIIPNFTSLKIKGITVKFKGKLAKGGNSRKKTFFYHRGYYSLSNKFLSLNRHKWNVWTKTGAVGCTLQIFY